VSEVFSIEVDFFYRDEGPTSISGSGSPQRPRDPRGGKRKRRTRGRRDTQRFGACPGHSWNRWHWHTARDETSDVHVRLIGCRFVSSRFVQLVFFFFFFSNFEVRAASAMHYLHTGAQDSTNAQILVVQPSCPCRAPCSGDEPKRASPLHALFCTTLRIRSTERLLFLFVTRPT